MSEGAFVAFFFTGLLGAPFLMGGARDWAWSPLVMLFGALAVWHTFGLGLPSRSVRPAEQWVLLATALCFVGVVMMGLLQMSPLAPPSWHAALYARAATVLDRAVTGLITIDADASRDILMKTSACGAVFLMARETFAEPRRARLFLLLLVISAVLVTAYGLLMHATNGSCYVFNYNKRPEATPLGRTFVCVFSGTFINSNSYAAYAGMALVAALGLVLSRNKARPDGQTLLESSPAAVWLTATRLCCVAAAFLLFGGLLLSNSRAGFGFTIMVCILLSLLLLRGRAPSSPVVAWSVVAIILAAALTALLTGSALFIKMERLSDVDLLGRFRIWQIAGSALAQSPWLGWGLGTFPEVYGLLQPPDMQIPTDRAHSTPLEWLDDLGAPAALCAFGTVLLPVWVSLRGALRRRSNRSLPAIAVAASLLAIVHSVIDFSLQIPAIGFTVSALLGLGWAHSFRRYE
jgi:O-antigen ligase